MIKVIARYARAYWWNIRSRITPKKIQVFALEYQLKFYYPLRSVIANALSIHDFETAERAFLAKVLKPQHIFLDIGANAGLFSLIAAKIVGTQGHVYAFEPSEREINMLRYNLEQNQIDHVTIINQAVADNVGTKDFAICSDGAMNSFLKTDHPSQHIETWQKVTLTTIDSFIKEYQLDHVDFIKIDVEGAEKLVFLGAKHFLSQTTPFTILFESNPSNTQSFGYTYAEIFEILRRYKLNIYYLNKNGEPRLIANADSLIPTGIYNFITTNYDLPVQ